MKMKSSFTLRLAVCVLLILMEHGYAYAQKNSGTIALQIEHIAGNSRLELDSLYQNNLGESFSVRKFRYYISNMQLEDAVSKKSYWVKDQYFLVDEANPASKMITLPIPAGSYRSVSFLLGVDSIKNVSGAQTGALDPLNDMFWTWRSGYVMAKLEGRSPVSGLPHRMFEYHIGGFNGTYNVLQRIQLNFGETLMIAAGKKATVNINADINAWFSAVHPLSIAQHPACTSEGALAKQYAENYSHMFSIESIFVP
ncbi:MAG: hypothetical protein KF862_03710 [Chitinophagaceae bacterium]|nr:hypothetical protein [Chitinophagaceae bacterium]